MKRSTIFTTMLCLALVAAWGAGAGRSNLAGRADAAVRPKPTPTPVGIAYDEINRMAFGQSTPAPVGSFSEDYQRIVSALASAAQNAPARPGGISGLIGQAMGVPPNAENPMLAMQNGTLKRYTFYWVRGWIRVDDPATHTAVIYKCKEHQTIYLDLAKKTYRVVTGEPAAAQSAPSAAQENPYARQMAQPGTAKMTVSAKAASLGPKTVEGIATRGYDSTNSLEISNATGSCRNGSFSSRVVEYISDVNEQRAYCPLPGRAGESASRYGGPAGGCRPSVTVRQTGSARPNPNKLAMYRMSSFGAGEGRGGAMVLERGHVKWLYNPEIPALFTVPAGFTQQS